MLPLIGGLLSGGANLLSGIFSSETSAQNTQAQIQASQQQQATQNAFQEQMSNTAYQRASADMKAAGLNPMMMFGSGSAASSPSGSSIQAPMPTRTSALANIGQAANSAVNAMVEGKLVDKMSEEIANMGADRAKTEATTQLIKGQQKIQDPEVRQAMIRMGYPDWLATSLTYGHDISKGIGEAGDAVWSLVPGGKLLRSIVGGGSAKSNASDSGAAFTPSQNRRIMDIVRGESAYKGAQGDAYSLSGSGSRPSAEMIKEFEDYAHKHFGY